VSAVVILLGDDGRVSAYNGSAGPVHVILDLSGVFR
jgi:hypothetical protein